MKTQHFNTTRTLLPSEESILILLEVSNPFPDENGDPIDLVSFLRNKRISKTPFTSEEIEYFASHLEAITNSPYGRGGSHAD